MSKSVNNLNFGDTVYSPYVEEIKESEVREIVKNGNGIKVGLGKYSGSDISESIFNAAISNMIAFDGGYKKIFYLNLEHAKDEQKKLRIAKLIELQNRLEKSIKELNEFTLKYFTDGKD